MPRHLLPPGTRLSLIRSRGQLEIRASLRHQQRNVSITRRQKRENFWIPTVSLKKQDGLPDATQLLIRAGYLRQAYSGIFHMLPLGLRVSEKLERLIDKHMGSIGASKVSLSSISSQALWQKSGRLNSGSEFFKFTDRKDAQWLLSPTHEEEITSLVADVVHSSSQLPVRLYQVSRKYRDEKRPRGGLLRGREFIMKDLYTFDSNQTDAHVTYDHVRQAYRNFLGELKVKYIEARADSGNMGGSLSHEYHFPDVAGEDDVISCNNCDHARNEEWVPDCSFEVEDILLKGPEESVGGDGQLTTEEVISKDHTSLIKAFAPLKTVDGRRVKINTYAIKAALDSVLELDTGVDNARRAFHKTRARRNSSDSLTVYYLFDPVINENEMWHTISSDAVWLDSEKLTAKIITASPETKGEFTLLKQTSGDTCPQCHTGTLSVAKAIEVGHTFHLGTRYSSKLGLALRPTEKAGEPVPVEMGCHGIGVSRLIAAIASSLSDNAGLNWPRAIAPFEAVIIVDGNDTERGEAADRVYDVLTAGQQDSVDTLLDDRVNVSNGYKLKDADLIGYPVIVVVGRAWQQSRQVEVQCRRLGVKEHIDLEDVGERVRGLLAQL